MQLETSVPTFSTPNIGREGHFYVGGHYVGDPGKEIMDGAMYVEVMVPKKIRHPYPVIFICGGAGQTAVTVLQTPDGRPGWAYDFLNQGYTVYMMDYPGRGRSLYIPLDAGRQVESPSDMLRSWRRSGRAAVRPRLSSNWPQHKKQTQWPSEAPNKGKMGDPVFDAFRQDRNPGCAGRNQLRNILLMRSCNCWI